MGWVLIPAAHARRLSLAQRELALSLAQREICAATPAGPLKKLILEELPSWGSGKFSKSGNKKENMMMFGHLFGAQGARISL